MTINNTWAYNVHDREFKSSQFLIRGLVEVASRGGNFLLNVGPQPDGVIQPEFQERLRAIGDWLRINGDSIYGTTYGPVQGTAAFRATAKDKKLFLHVFDWPASALSVPGVGPKVISAHLPATGQHYICVRNHPYVKTAYGTQSATNTLISCGTFAFRFEMKTSFVPSGENCGNALKPPAKVMRSSDLASRLTE
jgi:hypothetical protein